ncbi:hypothetical protein L1887_09086 [Cichorium endivia]|nr:hypothetical protein L1887_09086 [Cichorium endivia]
MEVSGALQLMKIAVKKFRKKSEDKHTTKTKNDTNIFVSLPDDVFIAILKRFPDAFLRYKAKYVCKRWFDVITNRILLDHASFILQKPTGIYTVRLVDIRKEGQGIEVKEQYLDIPHTGIVRSWCNEFLVIMDIYRKGRMGINVKIQLSRTQAIVSNYKYPNREHQTNDQQEHFDFPKLALECRLYTFIYHQYSGSI